MLHQIEQLLSVKKTSTVVSSILADCQKIIQMLSDYVFSTTRKDALYTDAKVNKLEGDVSKMSDELLIQLPKIERIKYEHKDYVTLILKFTSALVKVQYLFFNLTW